MTDKRALIVLAAALHDPGADPATLATRLNLDEADLREQLALLERRGLLRVTGDTIAHRRPDFTVATAIQQIIDDGVRELTDAAAAAHTLAASIPELLQAWNAGETGDGTGTSTSPTTVQGTWALADMWRAQSSRRAPRSAQLCIPSTQILRDAGLDYAETLWAARPLDGESRIRVILSDEDALDPINRWHLDNELAAGTWIRTHPSPPSFFWIIDDDTVTLPSVWGDPHPTRVLATSAQEVVSLASWVFEKLWGEATAVDQSDEPWAPMLALMSRGMTVEAAAHTLGLSPRTGRRRVDQAMRHFGVTGQFALGAVWGAQQAGRGRPPGSP